jgi:hypothetical protein
MLSCFFTTENLSIGANEKLLSRRFNMGSPTGGPEARTSGNGRNWWVEYAEHLVWPFLE